MPTTSEVSLARERIRSWIKGCGLPKAAIALQAGVDEKTVRQAAAPDWNPTVNTLEKLAVIVPLDWAPAGDVPARPKRRRPTDDRARAA